MSDTETHPPHPGSATITEIEVEREFTPRAILVLIGCAIGITFNVGTLVTGSISTLMKPISEATGWNRGEISLGVTFVLAPLVLILPWIGRLIDKIGPRKVLLLCGPLYGLAFAALGFVPTSLSIYLACCVVLGIVGAGTYTPTYHSLLSRYFKRNLGIAAGICSAGLGLGLLSGPIVTHLLVDQFGWRMAYVLLGATAATVVTGVALFLIRDGEQGAIHKPERVALAPFFRDRRLWRVAIAFLLTGGSIGAAVIHLVPMLSDNGFKPRDAALYASYLGMASLASRLAVGFLLDRVDAAYVGAIGCLFAMAGLVLLSLPAENSVTLLAVILVGVALGAEGDVMPCITQRLFGPAAYGTIVGFMASAFQTGVLLGPLIAGTVFDRLGSYRPASITFAICCALAATLFFTIKAPAPHRAKSRTKAQMAQMAAQA